METQEGQPLDPAPRRVPTAADYDACSGKEHEVEYPETPRPTTADGMAARMRAIESGRLVSLTREEIGRNPSPAAYPPRPEEMPSIQEVTRDLVAADAPPVNPEPVAILPEGMPAEFSILGTSQPLSRVVEAVIKRGGFSVSEWNELEPDDRSRLVSEFVAEFVSV